MFKYRKIDQFIEKYGWELSSLNFDELKKFLNDVPDIKNIITKINKLDDKDKDYVMDTINNSQKYNFSPSVVYMIINDKLDYLKSVKNKKDSYPNYDRFYRALSFNEKLYKSLVIDYNRKYILKYDYDEDEEFGKNRSLADYTEIFDEYCDEFHEIFSSEFSMLTLKKHLFCLSPEQMERLIKYNGNIQVKKEALEYISRHCDNFERLSMDEFNRSLDFIFDFKQISNHKELLEAKLRLIRRSPKEDMDNVSYLKILHNLPDNYILGMFPPPHDKYDIFFISLIRNCDEELGQIILDFIGKTHSSYNDDYYRMLNSSKFNNELDDDNKKFVLESLLNINNDNYAAYKTKVDVVMKCIPYTNKEYLDEVINFIRDDTNCKLINTKYEMIRKINPYLENGKISFIQFKNYIEILNSGLEEKGSDKKIKIIRNRADYIVDNKCFDLLEKHDVSKIELIGNATHKEDMESINNILNNKIIKNDEIVDMIVNRLISIDDRNDFNNYIKFVLDDYFINSSVTRQKRLLNLFDDKNINIGINNSNEIELLKPSPYLYEKISKSKKVLEFSNKDTGIKIFVKQVKKD